MRGRGGGRCNCKVVKMKMLNNLKVVKMMKKTITSLSVQESESERGIGGRERDCIYSSH